ncbi:MAG: glycine--tRNA ligase subunit beta [Spirochaetes bacterium]|jgi:glycyl-tRNA synthetase beta chain|nr:glycine--tRNA ligase subunit beta [Spirochaetota bacterium]
MWNRINFLLEIGSEEIPAGYISQACDSFRTLFEKKLEDASLKYSVIHTYATPRRIVIAIEELADSQLSETVEMRGPSVEKAFDDSGKPSKALEGFLRGNGAVVDDVEKRDTGKGIYVFIQKRTESRPATEILPGIIEDIITSVPFPKRMKWSNKSVTYPRPLRYLLTLFNDSILDYSIDGIASSNKTRGHYIQHNRMLDVATISEYSELLRSNGVLLDNQKRRDAIKAELSKAASDLDAVLVENDELFETVTYLVEDVNVVTCSFSEDFLAIPDIVLVAEMKEHQKYFALRKKDGSLMNKFCVISNNPATDFIREGNERVIAARFSDAEFFFKEDRKKKLSERVNSLKNVLFHKDLGSIFDKVERVRAVSHELVSRMQIAPDMATKIDRAVTLCKADLNTAMVFEFTSLQGEIGAIYARMDGEDPEVAQAIDNHYRPRFQGDEKPTDVISSVLSLSEKIDNLFGAWSVGNIPKGSQDPYALRRQAYAVVDLLIFNSINIDLNDLFESVAGGYKNGAELIKPILEFISVRAKTRFQEDGILYDEIDAVLTTGSRDYYELYNRALSIHSFRSKETFSQMLSSFKRMNNILISFIKKNPDYTFRFNRADCTGKYEADLAIYFLDKRDDVKKLSEEHNYTEIFEYLIGASAVIEDFFDNVMVIDEDEKKRDLRLGLLHEILGLFSRFIDFSKISD